MSCIKRQAEELGNFCEQRWWFLKENGSIEVNLTFCIKMFSERKNKNYSKLKERIEKGPKIETEKYYISYRNGCISVSFKEEPIKSFSSIIINKIKEDLMNQVWKKAINVHK